MPGSVLALGDSRDLKRQGHWFHGFMLGFLNLDTIHILRKIILLWWYYFFQF